MSWQLLAIISATFFGSLNLIQKRALNNEHTLAFLAGSHITMAILTLPIFLLTDIPQINLEQFLYIVLKSVLVVIFFYLYGQSLKHLEVSEFSPLTNLSPVFTIIIAVSLLSERITPMHLLGIFITILGTYVLELEDGVLSPFRKIKNNKYIHLLFYGLIVGAFCASLDKYLLNGKINALSYFAYQRITIAILLFTLITILYGGIKDIKKVYSERPFSTFFSGIFFMIADYAYFLALAAPGALVSLVITVKRSGTLIPTFAGGEIFKEKHILKKTIACLIMIFGIFLIVK
jgi:drug/metabolite transporter (DMT)-like permease